MRRNPSLSPEDRGDSGRREGKGSPLPRVLAALALLALAAVFLPALLFGGRASFPDPTASPLPSPAALSPADPAPEPTPRDALPSPSGAGGVALYYRETLSPEDRQIYDALCRTVEAQEETAEGIPVPDSGRVLWIYGCVLRDRPEYFWLDGSCSYSYQEADGGFRVDFSPGYAMDLRQRQEMQRELDRVREEVVGRFGTLPDYEKALGVYDYVIDHSAFGDSPLDYGICAVLVEGRGTCISYSKAAQYLLQQLGIPALLVGGIGNGEPHAWNIVLLDGEYYQMDVTWGDPIHDDGSQDKNYLYFCLTDEEMYRDHRPEEEYTLPSCSSAAANWYRREGRWAERYDEDWLLDLMRRDLEQGRELRFRCADEAVFDEYCRKLLEEDRLFSLLEQAGFGGGYRYSLYESLNALSFQPN